MTRQSAKRILLVLASLLAAFLASRKGIGATPARHCKPAEHHSHHGR